MFTFELFSFGFLIGDRLLSRAEFGGALISHRRFRICLRAYVARAANRNRIEPDARSAGLFGTPSPIDITPISGGIAGVFRVECNQWRDRQLSSLPRHN